jgi:hypothetical protein
MPSSLDHVVHSSFKKSTEMKQKKPCCSIPLLLLPLLQVLSGLPALEICDLSFNVYMEAASSLSGLLEGGGLSKLQRLDLRHAPRVIPCCPAFTWFCYP